MENVTLEQLNDEAAKEYLGGVTFVAIIMTIGFLGNLHILIVYTFFMKPSNHRIFILVLGTVDFITCVVGMPFIIVDLRNPLTFTISSACKILRFINYFICTSSALTLVVIAVDRYRKICMPLKKPITSQTAMLLCGMVMVVAALFSWPAPVLYGIAEIQTQYNLTGTRCWTENRMYYDSYQGYFNITLIVLVSVIFVVLTILYYQIGRVVVRLVESRDHSNSNEANTTKSTVMTSDLSSSTDEKTADVISMDQTTTSPASKIKPKNFKRAKRTTLMFLVITAVFFLSYMPHLILQIIGFIDEKFLLDMSFTGRVLYHTFLWSFFINNMSNCFIYGFYDARFRSGIKRLYQTIPCRR